MLKRAFLLFSLLLTLHAPAYAGVVSDLQKLPSKDLYRVLRSLALEVFPAPDRSWGKELLAEDGEYSVFGCDGPSYWFDTSLVDIDNERLSRTLRFAGSAAGLSKDLKSLGLTSGKFHARLLQIEVESLSALLNAKNQDAAEEKIASRLIQVIVKEGQRTKTRLPHMAYLPCGGSDAPRVKILASPKNARLYLLSEFDYKLCQVRKADAYDMEDCDVWKEAPSGEEYYGPAGIYRYVLVLNGRINRKGRIDMDQMDGKTFKINAV